MAQNFSNAEKRLLRQSVRSQFFRRVVASYLVRFGGLDNFRREAVGAGDVNWRIVRYQRVLNPEEENLPVPAFFYVRPQTLEKHLHYLSRSCNVISLDELVELLVSKAPVPEKTVVITFDGGWTDTYTNAFPVLKIFSLPVTVFLPTTFIGTQDWFWPEKVLFAMLQMAEQGEKFPVFSFLADDPYFMESLETVAPDQEITLAGISLMIEALKRVSVEERLTALGVFLVVIDMSGGLPDTRYFMNWDEIAEMKNAGVSFGSLGHTHATLNELEMENIAIDLRESFQTLRAHSITPSKVFCYPDGLIDKESRTFLYKNGIPYGLGIGKYTLPTSDVKATTILGRVQAFEAATFSAEMFACHLWNARFLGISF